MTTTSTTLSLREAAEAVGMSKPGLLKAIKAGKVSAERDVNGQYQIEPVELFRVYAPVPVNGHAPNGISVNGNSTLDFTGQVNSSYREETPDCDQVIVGLQAENALLLARLADKDETIAAKNDLIDALRGENSRLTRS